MFPSLRRHYPVQVQTVGGFWSPPSQPKLVGLPLTAILAPAVLPDLGRGLQTPAAPDSPPVPRLRRPPRRLPGGRAARRRGHRPAPDQGRLRRRDPGRGAPLQGRVRRARRPVHPQRPSRPGRRRATPTASTWARTTPPWRRRARAHRRRQARSASRPTAPSRSTRPRAPTWTTSASGPSTRRRPSPGGRRWDSSSCATRRPTRPSRSSRSAASRTANVDAVAAAGAERIAVVRALTEAADPRARRRRAAPERSQGGRERELGQRSRKRGQRQKPAATHRDRRASAQRGGRAQADV